MIRNYVAFDLETTGLNVETDSIIEIGALKVIDGKVQERFMEFVKPAQRITPMITEITGITNEMVAEARDTKEIIGDFVSFCGDYPLIGHNIMFDFKFTKKYAESYGYRFQKKGLDTLKIARKVHKDLPSKSLGCLCEHYKITNQAAHRAYYDALATANLYQHLAHAFEETEAALFEPEELQYKFKKVQPCTKKQVQFYHALCEQHQIAPECDINQLSRSEASRMIDQLIARFGK